MKRKTRLIIVAAAAGVAVGGHRRGGAVGSVTGDNGHTHHRAGPRAGRGGRARAHRWWRGDRDRSRRRGELLRGRGDDARRPPGRRAARRELRRGRLRDRRTTRTTRAQTTEGRAKRRRPGMRNAPRTPPPPKRSLPGRRRQQPSRSIGDTGSSHCNHQPPPRHPHRPRCLHPRSGLPRRHRHRRSRTQLLIPHGPE